MLVTHDIEKRRLFSHVAVAGLYTSDAGEQNPMPKAACDEHITILQ